MTDQNAAQQMQRLRLDFSNEIEAILGAGADLVRAYLGPDRAVIAYFDPMLESPHCLVQFTPGSHASWDVPNRREQIKLFMELANINHNGIR